MLLAIANNSIRNTAIDTGYMFEQGGRGRIDLDTREVDTGYHNPLKHRGQFLLIDIVLIQTHSDSLRINLDEFGQWILQTPCDRNGPAPCSIERGKLLASNL